MLNSIHRPTHAESGFPISTFTLTLAEMKGRDACKAGELMRNNPYDQDTEEHASWIAGWKGWKHRDVAKDDEED